MMIQIHKVIRRGFDLLFSVLCLLILSPILITIAFFIKMDSRGPIFFKQKRVGQQEKPFYIYKFRSMHLHEQSPMELGAIKHNHSLVTRVGYIIRRFKLDELPQFINVLSGNMSLIGPRPCLFERIDTMSQAERRRFNVAPGLTGWAEINGNVELTWDEQLMLDLWYVDHQSFWLDIMIFWRTIIIMLFGSVRNEVALQKAETYLNKQ